MSINWIEHAGRKILYVDYRNCMTQEDMIDQLDEVTEPIERADFMSKAKQHARDVYVKKDARHAIVGIVGFTRMLLHGYIAFSGSQHTRLLATEDEAKKWLTS